MVFLTPLQRGVFSDQPIYPAPNGWGTTLNQYVQAIKDVASMYAIPVCDLFNISGINKVTLSTYTSDNLHPNTLGHVKISKTIASFLETL